MLPSVLAKSLAPCLGTIQTQPISVGAPDALGGRSRFDGHRCRSSRALGPQGDADGPAGPPINRLQPLRDQTLNELYDLYKNAASPAQKSYLDSLVTSQLQVRSINQSLLDQLSSIKDNSAASQILAALALIQMNVTPVVAIHIPVRRRQPPRRRARDRDGGDGLRRRDARLAHAAASGGGPTATR